MSVELLTGNLDAEAAKSRGWVIGRFLGENSPFKTDGFEVKWSRFKKGEGKSSVVETAARTLVVLINGRYRLKSDFWDKEVVLENEGDYCFYNPNLPHQVEALEDTLVLIIRWPSISSK